MLMTRNANSALFISLMILGAGMVSGQDYPNKPIRIVTGSAGGGNDFAARIIAQGISGSFGQPVVIDNRSGGSMISAEVGAKALPDGYTLLVAGSALWIIPLLEIVKYDVQSDYSPISLVSREIKILVVNPSLPVKTVKELIALAKDKPGVLNYSTGINGSASHLAGELFKQLAGVNIVHVPYKGSVTGVTALLSGEVQLTFNDPNLVMPHVKLGKLRALAVTSATPSALAPGLPTVAASGVPGYEAVGMIGLWAPAKTPVTIINRLNREVVRVFNVPDVKERFLNAGGEIVVSSPEQFAATIKADISSMAKVIKDAGIRVQ